MSATESIHAYLDTICPPAPSPAPEEEPINTPDDLISRLDLMRHLEAEAAKVRARANPLGCLWNEDQAQLMTLRGLIDYVHAMRQES